MSPLGEKVHVALAVIGMALYALGLFGAGFFLRAKSVEDDPDIRPVHFWRYELDSRLGMLIIMLSGLHHWSPVSILVGGTGMAVLEASIFYFAWVTHRTPWHKPLPKVGMTQALAGMGIGFGFCFLALSI